MVFATASEQGGALELWSAPLDGKSGPIRIGGPLVSSGGVRWTISPAGQRVVYLGEMLSSVPIDGSAEPIALSESGALPRDFLLAADGTRVVYRAAPPGRFAGLYSVAIDGSSRPIELVAPNDLGEVEPTYSISPGSDSVVFTSVHEDGVIARPYSAPIDGGPVVSLDGSRLETRDLRISPDGGRVFYLSTYEGMLELRTALIDGSEPPARLSGVPRAGEDVQGFEPSPDGGWVAYLRDQGDGRNALFSVRADGSSEPVHLAGDVASSFQIHPASALVLFLADRAQDERFELYGALIDGSRSPSRLSAPLPPGAHVGWFGITPDGTRIVYQVRPGADRSGEESELWQVPLLDGSPPTRLVESADARDLGIAPDGRRIVYLDSRGSLHSVALDGSAQPSDLAPGLTSHGFQFSPDGSRVVSFLFHSADGEESPFGLTSVPIAGDSPPVRLGGLSHTRHGGRQTSTAAAGFRDFSFGTTGGSTPSGEKPECKLWWNDGSWWGSLYNDAAQDWHIYRLNLSNQTWVDTGTLLDDRTSSKADVLWDAATQKLYVASHIFTTNAVATPSNWGRLFRYSYNASSKTYSRDAGYPVDITRGNAEDLTIAKDSLGRLWATWVQDSEVMVNHSLSSDLQWAAPSVLPVSSRAASVTSDDISGIVAFGGNRIGVMWSNQVSFDTFFAVHRDSDAPTVWQPEEIVSPGPNCSGACSDDHVSLKADASGRVWAVIKTGLTGPDEALNLVAVRASGGGWNTTVFGQVRDHHTRAILLLDEQNQEVYVFATTPEAGGSIYGKKAPFSNPRFEPGLGTPFIQSSNDVTINNATSTKQNLNGQTDLVVLASDQNTRFYLHGFLDLGAGGGGGGGGNPPTIAAFNPTSGPAGTNVTITGTNFGGTNSVRFNGTAAGFTVDSSTQIRATVPGGATTGKISVTTPGGTATSAASFTVNQPQNGPTITSFSPTSGPVGTNVTITGTNFGGTTSVRFNGTAAGFTVNSSTQIRATVPGGATTGKIGVTTSAGAATSSGAFTVTQSPSISSFSPTSGPVGTSVTVTGANFSGATSVRFNGAAASFTVVSNSQIRATVPGGATTGKISVTAPGGTATSSSDFRVTRPPVIDSFVPTFGPVLTPVTIFGSSLSGATRVEFNGKPATFAVLPGGAILASVPIGATSGKIRVTTPAGTATSATNFTVVGL